MIGTRGKQRVGKRNCDLCGREASRVHEFKYQIYDGLTHWVDLCAECGAVDRAVKDGFLKGLHWQSDGGKKPVKGPLVSR